MDKKYFKGFSDDEIIYLGVDLIKENLVNVDEVVKNLNYLDKNYKKLNK